MYHCGPYWFPIFLKKILSVWFNDQCRIHDDDYLQGKKTKDDYDYEFLESMLSVSDSWYKKLTAYILYLAVRTPWGMKSWERNREIHG